MRLTRPDNGKRASGAILYRGPSAVDGTPIAVVLVGLAGGSSNSKTGAMLQTYILLDDVAPLDALATGTDVSICGDCAFRSPASGGNGGCYVQVGRGVQGVWHCLKRGGYPRIGPKTAARVIRSTGLGLRIGSYGDPASVPRAAGFWGWLAEAAPFHTGYTHAPHLPRGRGLRGICHASADTLEQARTLRAAGWSTFRVARCGDGSRDRGEARCPASAEAGKRRQCATCPSAMRCDGLGLSVVIQAHGATRKRIRG